MEKKPKKSKIHKKQLGKYLFEDMKRLQTKLNYIDKLKLNEKSFDLTPNIHPTPTQP